MLIIATCSFDSYRKEKQYEAQMKICDTMRYVNENQQIFLHGFEPGEIKKLTFYLVRKNKIVRTIISSSYIEKRDSEKYASLQIPFKSFLLTDTIIVKTYDNLYFEIKYEYYTERFRTMFGYAGFCECSLLSTVNNQESSSNTSLMKDSAIKNNILP